MSRNVRNAAVALSQHGLGAVAGAAGIFFVARFMPRADFHLGVVGFGLGFVGLFLSLQRAFDMAHVKRVSEGRDLARCVGAYLLLKTASTSAMIAIVLGGVYLFTGPLGQGFQTPLHVVVIELFLVYQVLNAVGEVARRTLEGRHNILLGQVALAVEHVVKGGAMIYVAFNGLEPWLPGTRTAQGIAGAYVIGAAAMAIVSLGLLANTRVALPSRALMRSYVKFAIPSALTASLMLINANVSAVIIQLFWGARDVGLFFAPNRYVQFLPAVSVALTTALFPVYSAMHASGRTAPAIVERTLRAVSLLLLPAVAVSVALPEAVVHVLLSDLFLASAPVLQLLAVGAYVTALRLVLATKLGGIDRPHEATKAALVSMVTNVVLTIVLVAPAIGPVPLAGLKATGAALAVTVAGLAGFGQTAKAARIHAEVIMPRLGRHLLMVLGTIGVLLLLPLVVPQTSFRVWHLAGASVLALVVFTGLGLLLREVSKGDLLRLWNAVHPREWKAFLAEERRNPNRRERE